MVTGELTHCAIWLEDSLIEIISDYFIKKGKVSDFRRLILHRDGLTFQHKIEIVEGMLPLFKNPQTAERLKALLRKVEEFKKYRNAFAHGRDATPHKNAEDDLEIHIEIVGRNGKEKTTIVTPASHHELLKKTCALMDELKEIRMQLSGKRRSRRNAGITPRVTSPTLP